MVGQIFFQIIIVPILKITSRKRIEELIDKYDLDTSEQYKRLEDRYAHVENINSDSCIKMIKSLLPDIIIVNGTRILSSSLIEATGSIIINMHLGITPKYRGVHGAYWALYNQDYQHMGVTIHLVDKGIDTGGILHQSTIEITQKDNFCTYPFVQIGEGIALEISVINDIMDNRVGTIENRLPSVLYSHPTIWQYLYGRIIKKVK